jgi:hypothetical protein
MGGDLLTPLSTGLEGLSLAGETQPSYQVHPIAFTCPTLICPDYNSNKMCYAIIDMIQMYDPARV